MERIRRIQVNISLVATASGFFLPYMTSATPAGGAPLENGVVVETVGPGSAMEKAGIRPGDVLLAWERLPNPPSNPEGVQGEIASIFDWEWLLVEQVPRGRMLLLLHRADQAIKVEMPSQEFSATIRPRIPPSAMADYVQGKERIGTNDVEAARELWSNITEKTGADTALACWLSIQLGEAWVKNKEIKNAQANFRKALGSARSGRNELVIGILIGNAYLRNNQLDLAAETFQSLLTSQARWDVESLVPAYLLSRLGTVSDYRADLKPGQSYFQDALAEAQRIAPDSLMAAGIANSLSVMLGRQGKLREAESLQRYSLQIHERVAPASIPTARVLNNMGTVLWLQGNLAETEQYDTRALEIRLELIPDSLDLANSFHDLGLLSWARGDLDLAEERLDRSLEIRQRRAPDSLEMANNLSSLGLLALARHQHQIAESYFQQALDIRQRYLPDSLRVAHSLHNLSIVARLDNRFNDAIEAAREALVIRERLAPDSIQVSDSLHSLGLLASDQGRLQAAEDYIRRALMLRRQLAPGGLKVATSLDTLGDLLAQRGSLDDAMSYLHDSLKIRASLSPLSSEEAWTLHRLGTIHYAKGEVQAAAELFDRALHSLESQVGKLGVSPETEVGFRAEYSEYYRHALESLLDLGSPGEAFQVLERSRARAFLNQIAERDLDLATDLPKELDQSRRNLARLYDRKQQRLSQLSPTADSAEVRSLSNELRSLREELDDLVVEIRKTSKAGDLHYPQPLDLPASRHVLDPQTVMLSYSLGEDASEVFVVSQRGYFDVRSLALGEEGLQRRVKQFTELMPLAFSGDQTGALHSLSVISKQLYRELIAPVADAVAESDRVLIIPDGPLHLLPWSALIRETPGEDRGWQYLAEWKPIHVALSATVYAELKRQRKAYATADSSIRLAAFGDPSYPGDVVAGSRDGIADVRLRSAVERGMFDWSPLPDTRREVEQISSLFPSESTRIHLGAEATEEAAKATGRGTRIVHFATHGHLDDRFPLNSALVLSIPERFSDDRDNGYLQVWEIFERVRLDADLVVLSACASALGKEQGGEGLIGLTRAFQYAGARSVVASLWNVRDQATAELMVRFYRHLNAGKSKDEALRAAQIELIRGPVQVPGGEGRMVERDFSAPYYWAAFQVYGDWQ